MAYKLHTERTSVKFLRWGSSPAQLARMCLVQTKSWGQPQKAGERSCARSLETQFHCSQRRNNTPGRWSPAVPASPPGLPSQGPGMHAPQPGAQPPREPAAAGMSGTEQADFFNCRLTGSVCPGWVVFQGFFFCLFFFGVLCFCGGGRGAVIRQAAAHSPAYS